MTFKNFAFWVMINIMWIGALLPGTALSQSIPPPPITVNPNDFPDDYNYETGPLVRALKANDALYHFFVNGCTSACAYNEKLCNVRSKNMGLFSYDSTENLPKSWSDLKCMLDVKDQANPGALMKVCATVCTENACYGDDFTHQRTRDFCAKLCCQTAVNMENQTNPSFNSAKNDAKTFIGSCHGSQGFGPNGICTNYFPNTDTNAKMGSRAPSHVMRPNMVGPNTRNMILHSPMQPHPAHPTHPPMNNTIMRDKMNHLPHPPVNTNPHNMNNHRMIPHTPSNPTMNRHNQQIRPHTLDTVNKGL